MLLLFLSWVNYRLVIQIILFFCVSVSVDICRSDKGSYWSMVLLYIAAYSVFYFDSIEN